MIFAISVWFFIVSYKEYELLAVGTSLGQDKTYLVWENMLRYEYSRVLINRTTTIADENCLDHIKIFKLPETLLFMLSLGLSSS
jgi:hypothetical protein